MSTDASRAEHFFTAYTTDERFGQHPSRVAAVRREEIEIVIEYRERRPVVRRSPQKGRRRREK
ncbi:MAG: hypothetical protein ACLFUX_09130 [Spirochaetaceae bacterium]